MSTPLVDLLHVLMCQEEHDFDMMMIPTRDPSKCYYYLESDISGGDELPDHLKWHTRVYQLKMSLGFQDDNELLEFIKEVVRISKRIRDLEDSDDLKGKFIKSILY